MSRFINMKAWILSVACVVMIGCDTVESPADRPSRMSTQTVEQLVQSLGRLEEVSGGEVPVNPELAMLCRLASPDEIAKAEKTYGPHAQTFIRVSMNEAAVKALRDMSTYPPGAAIVKVKNTGATGGMIKRESGYDDLGGDWEYFYAEAKGRLERGKLETCRTCHMTTRSTDHVFGSWKPTQRTQEP